MTISNRFCTLAPHSLPQRVSILQATPALLVKAVVATVSVYAYLAAVMNKWVNDSPIHHETDEQRSSLDETNRNKSLSAFYLKMKRTQRFDSGNEVIYANVDCILIFVPPSLDTCS